MKSLLILILASLPLVVLTILAFTGLSGIGAGGSGAVPPPPGADTVIEAAHTRVATETPPAAELDEVAAFNPKPIPGAVPPGSFLDDFFAKWSNWVVGHKLLNRCQRICLAPSTTLEQLQAKQEDLRKLKDDLVEAQLSGSDGLVGELNDNIRRMQNDIIRWKQTETANKLYIDANRDFDDGNYMECMQKCNTLCRDYADVFDTKRAEHLHGRAEFKLDSGNPALRRPAVVTGEKLDNWVNELRKFVAKYGDDNQLEKDEEYLVAGKANQLQTAIRLRPLLKQLGEAIKNCGKLSSISRRVSCAVDFLGKSPVDEIKAEFDIDFRAEIGKCLREWLIKGIPEKRFPWATGQVPPQLEVEVKTGGKSTIYRGYIKRTEDATGYMIYTSVGDFNRGIGGGFVAIADVVRRPGEPLPNQCVFQYNREREKLVSNLADESSWEKFEKLCRGLEQQLQDYRKKQNSLKGTTSFRSEAQFAREVLGKGNWANVKKLLQP